MTLNQPKKSLCGAGLFSGKGESLATALHKGARNLECAGRAHSDDGALDLPPGVNTHPKRCRASLATALHKGAPAIWSAPAELSATTALSICRPVWILTQSGVALRLPLHSIRAHAIWSAPAELSAATALSIRRSAWKLTQSGVALRLPPRSIRARTQIARLPGCKRMNSRHNAGDLRPRMKSGCLIEFGISVAWA